MNTTDVAKERQGAVSEAVQRIREIEHGEGVTPQALARIGQILAQLAGHTELFDEQEFPNPPPGERARLHVLSEDEGGRFPLYLTCCQPGGTVPPHNHTTWAVVAGLSGQEANTVWQRVSGGLEPGPATIEVRDEMVVGAGEYMALMPDDVHSVATPGEVPRRHFHMYGLSLQRLPVRLIFDREAGTCEYMPPNDKIVGQPVN